MTEPVMDFTDGDAPAPRRRGRPRSPETVERDQRVLTLLQEGPRTKEQLVEALGSLKPTHVYLSLWRLARAGHVERTSDAGTRHLWRVVA